MKTAVEWLVDEIKIQQQMYIDLAKKNKSLKKEVDAILTASTLIIMKSEQAKAMEEQNKYSMADLRNSYRWGASAESATSEHFSEFVNNLKQQEQ
jgi:hypothetical protein